MAEHAVLAGRARLSVAPEHGPGAAARNARRHHAGHPPVVERAVDTARDVEVRDLAVYERLLDELVEAA
jgi:hypothetical protein